MGSAITSCVSFASVVSLVFFTSFASFAMSVSGSAHAGPTRETYKFDRFTNNPALSQHSFGLRGSQRQAIFELTQGKVDLRYHFYRDQMTQSILSILSPTNFRGFISFNVPPPVIIETAIDPEADHQYWLENIHAPEAWPLATGKGVTIADCDSGYYAEESDLAPNFLMEHRYNLSDPDSPFNISEGPWVLHGTAVTAIMAGAKDGKGTQGIAYDAKIVPLQNFTYSALDKLDKEEATARCILRAITIQRVKIIVLENQTNTGSSETFAGTREAVKLAIRAGITIVSAGGNYSQELKTEAAEDTDSIIVGALTRQGYKAPYSNYGARVCVAAFGEQLHTLFGPNGKFDDFGGTSGATPQVAATVALMLEVNPKLSPAQLKAILVATRVESADTKDVGGLLHTLAAVQKAKISTVDEKESAAAEDLRADLSEILALD